MHVAETEKPSNPISLETFFRNLSLLLASISMAIGGANLLGLLINKPYLITFGVEGPPISFIAANYIFLLSIGILIKILVGTNAFTRTLIRFAALLCFFFGFASLLQYITNAKFRIDHIFDVLSPEGAVASIFFSFGLLFTVGHPLKLGRAWLDHVCSLITASIALFSLSGYAFDAPMTSSILFPQQASGMAFPLAIAFFCLPASWILADTNRGIMILLGSPRAGGYMARRLLFTLFLAPPFISLLIRFGRDIGLYPDSYLHAISTVILCTVFLFLTWTTAQRLDETDTKRFESEQRFRRIAHSVSDVIFSFRLLPKPKVEFLSSAAATVFGIPNNKLMEHPRILEEIVHPQDAKQLKEILSTSGASQSPSIFRWIQPDGNIVWTEVRHVPFFNSNGALEKIEGVLRDITEQKLAEAEREDFLRRLANQKSWLEQIIDRTPTGMLILSKGEQQKLILNRKARDFFGTSISWEGEEIQTSSKILWPNNTPMLPKDTATQRAINGEEVTQEEIIVTREERKIPVLVNSTPIFDSNRSIIGAVTVFEDISLLKELETLREEWASVIAHDLRQPITAIELQSQLLLRKLENRTDVKRFGEHIQKSAKQLARMTSDLLDISRLESRRLSLELQPTDIRKLVPEILERLGLDLRGRTITLKGETDLPEVMADPGRLEQVIGNLLSNAIKYSYPNSEILFEFFRKEDGVEFAVTNEGEGIKEPELRNLFQRFERAKSAKAVKGIGLGLYITKGLIEAHGGRIVAESTPGKTTTFRVQLPSLISKAA